MIFILGFIFGFLNDAAYMLSAIAASRGQVPRTMISFLIFFGAAMSTVHLMATKNYLGVFGAALGGAAGVGYVAYGNRKEPNSTD